MLQSIYTSTARFDKPVYLDDDAIYKAAPSVFQTEAHESRSERFRPIPTIDVVRAMRKEGFEVVGVKQAVSRVPGKADFTKHLLRFRQPHEEGKYQVGDNVLEALLKNANDGTAPYELMAGIFRIRCENSLVSQTSTIDTIKVRHTGNAIDNVIDGTYRVLDAAETVLAAPQDWGQLQLPKPAVEALAMAAHTIRFGEVEEGHRPAIAPEQLLIARRVSDQGGDLWTKFNVVQENMIKGGLHGGSRDANNHYRRTTTRQVKGIDQDLKLNKALWLVGEQLAQTLKQAA